MQIFKTTHNGNEYEFICEWSKTRNGFKHECRLFVNGNFETSATCQYLNRTWEKYDYQSVMFSAVSNLYHEREDFLKYVFKSDNGYEKMTKKRNEEFMKVLEADELLAELNEVKDKIEKGF